MILEVDSVPQRKEGALPGAGSTWGLKADAAISRHRRAVESFMVESMRKLWRESWRFLGWSQTPCSSR
jgi:hypothetical protein